MLHLSYFTTFKFKFVQVTTEIAVRQRYYDCDKTIKPPKLKHYHTVTAIVILSANVFCVSFTDLTKMASDLTAKTVNTHVLNSGIPANMLKKLILLLISKVMILFDKTAHVTGEMMSFK